MEQGFGTVSVDYCNGIAVDTAGNVALGGRFRGAIDFGGGPLANAGGYDLYVAKFNANGDHMWSASYGDIFTDTVYGIACDSADNTYITGIFRNTVDFGGGPLTSNGSDDIFLACFDPAGVHLWSRSYGGPLNDSGRALAIDSQDNLALVGDCYGGVDFGDGYPTTSISRQIFVAKYNRAGAYIWSKQFGGTGINYGYGVATDPSNNIFLTGSFRVTADFGGGTLTSAGGDDIFLAEFNPYGAHLWSARFGGAGYDSGKGVAADNSGNIILGGDSQGAIDFGGGVITSVGGYDSVIAHFNTTANLPPAILAAVDVHGNVSGTILLSPGSVSGVGDGAPRLITAIKSISPNPFNPATKIAFSVKTAGQVQVDVHDIRGRHVRTLVNEVREPGTYTVMWRGTDDNGQRVASGTYLCRLHTASGVISQSMTLVK